MEKLNDRAMWGTALILFGIAFLLRSVLGDLGYKTVLGGLSCLVGVAFLARYRTGPEQWWSIIPGLTMIGLGGSILLSLLSGTIADALAGTVLIAAIGVSFLVIFFQSRSHWWALIPGGIMMTVATVALVEGLDLGIDGGSLMMFGMAATFGLVSLVEVDGKKLRWALIPAGILLALGVFVLSENLGVMGILWPLLIIAAGIAFVIRSYTAES